MSHCASVNKLTVMSFDVYAGGKNQHMLSSS